MRYYLIPARRNSKGLPFKNRKFFEHTARIIPPEVANQTILATDDEELLKQGKELGWITVKRPSENTTDKSTPKEFMEFVAEALKLKATDTIVLLYLTYPERTWQEVQNIEKIFEENSTNSLLCRQEVATHPYLCINQEGEFLFPHNLSRRQDYPEVWEISHYVGIFRVGEIKNLSDNLYSSDTYYHFIPRVRNIDTPED